VGDVGVGPAPQKRGGKREKKERTLATEENGKPKLPVAKSAGLLESPERRKGTSRGEKGGRKTSKDHPAFSRQRGRGEGGKGGTCPVEKRRRQEGLYVQP